MAFAYWAILLAGIMPVLTVALAKAQRGYDNNNPRDWLARQAGWRQRADFAHRNHFEAFPFFAAAVLAALQMHAPIDRVNLLAGIFIAARVAYTVCYLLDWATLRSVAWFIAYGSILALFFQAAA